MSDHVSTRLSSMSISDVKDGRVRVVATSFCLCGATIVTRITGGQAGEGDLVADPDTVAGALRAVMHKNAAEWEDHVRG